MPLSAELILRNARPEMPGNGPGDGPGNGPGDALAVAGGRIAGVGRYADLAALAGPATEVIDCGGRAIIPGLDDAHCHPFAAARAAAGVDCRPAATPDVAAIVNALRAAAAATPGDGWVRGYGYDDSPAGLGRHLRRDDLDAVSRRRPVRVEHRSGHACVLNTAGLRAAGIGRSTPEPDGGGVIVRDAAGEPTGLLLEMSGWLRARAGTASKRRSRRFPGIAAPVRAAAAGLRHHGGDRRRPGKRRRPLASLGRCHQRRGVSAAGHDDGRRRPPGGNARRRAGLRRRGVRRNCCAWDTPR